MSYKEASILKSKTYEIEITGDKSPTLRPDQKESMHHMAGAASESVYLYYEALARYFSLSLNNPNRVTVLSFGFGLGYNEVLTVIYFLKHKLDISQLVLVSYEKDLFLYELFNSWLEASSAIDDSVFDGVWSGIKKALRLSEHEMPLAILKETLKQLLASKDWSQLGPVANVDDFNSFFDVVFYDAFSAKTNEFLWSELFLNDFFKTKLNSKLVFSTYACTAVLKRVAAVNHCEFDKRDGFMGKRNSSLIYRIDKPAIGN